MKLKSKCVWCIWWWMELTESNRNVRSKPFKQDLDLVDFVVILNAHKWLFSRSSLHIFFVENKIAIELIKTKICFAKKLKKKTYLGIMVFSLYFEFNSRRQQINSEKAFYRIRYFLTFLLWSFQVVGTLTQINIVKNMKKINNNSFNCFPLVFLLHLKKKYVLKQRHMYLLLLFVQHKMPAYRR